jgi:glycosyltransferase involved in cell wall biosynthesis
MRRSILPMKDMQAYRQIVELLRRLKPDVVHTHSSKAGILGRRAARAAEVPWIVHTVHGLAFTASTSRLINGFYKRLERRAAAITDRIFCVADAMRDQSLEAGIGRRGQYVTVYSGMETEPFLNPPVSRLDVRNNLGLRDEYVVVGTIARLFHLKGHEDLLDLAPSLCGQFPNLRFLWLGDGLLRGALEQRIQQMGFADRFILPGLIPPAQIPQMVNAMDILVHPSRREGLARALPQGSLAGCPVICYDIDGNREALVDQKTGFLVKPFNRQDLSQRIAELMNDAPRGRAMGAAGREFALARFDWRVMIDALEQVYTLRDDPGNSTQS